MARIINYHSPRDHYKAQACIVWCFDNRFSPLLVEFIKQKNIGSFDLIKIGGGIKDLASPEVDSDKKYLLDQIKKSITFHKPKEVFLMAHANCGGYGKKFEKASKEEKFYRDELDKAENAVKVEFGELIKTTKIYANFDKLEEF